MKTIAIVAVAGLTLASVAAYAQMRHEPGDNMPMQQRQGTQMGSGMMHGMMQERMRDHMGSGMMHGDTTPSGMHGAHGSASGAQPKGDTGPSSLAFQGINAKMHGAMNIAFTGNADVDFVKGMIPHHEGAVDMAKTVLAFGKDPEVKKLAEEVIKAQQSEIAMMREWLKKNGQ